DPHGAAYVQFGAPDRPEIGVSVSGPVAEALRASATRLEGLATYRGMLLRLTAPGGRPLDARAQSIYGDFFEVLGVRAAAGRLLAAHETGPDADPLVVVVSEALARDLFGSVPA